MNKITDDIIFAGVNDRKTVLFENQFPIPNGVTYNSYVILDEKTMVIATTEEGFIDEWMNEVGAALGGRMPDYLLIQHMEPDHSAAVKVFMDKYPQCIIAASKQALNMVKNFFGTDYAGRNLVIKEGDSLSLGKHELIFVSAPMVHWPEVMLAYERTDKVLFSSDAFGRFGAPLNEQLDAASPEYEAEPWLDEARRYYTGIVGKYGDPVNKVLDKAAGLDISIICALHGPVLRNDLGKYIEVYRKWASYAPEEEGIAICYSTVYGHTKEAVDYLINVLKELDKGLNHCEPEHKGAFKVEVFDLTKCDMSQAIAAAFRYDRIVFAATTYNNGVFPCMVDFIERLNARSLHGRKAGLIENGSWGPKAASLMKEMLGADNYAWCENTVTIKSAMNDETRQKLAALAQELIR